MSTNRLTADERATFLIGAAFRRFIENKTVDRISYRLVWAAYVQATDASLTPDERHHVMIETGFTDDSWLAAPGIHDSKFNMEEGIPEEDEIAESDDGIPF